MVDKLEEKKPEVEKENGKYIKIKKFHFVLSIFFVIFITAGITTVVLTFGDEPAQPIQQIIQNRKEFNKLYSAYDTLKEKYFTEVDDEKLINGAINGMLEALDDPYSDYMNVEEAKSFHQQISSSFEGIGAEIQSHNSKIMIVSPIKGSPAEKAGLKPNDYILSVDGKSLQGMSATEAVMQIRGKKGTKVELMIQRGENAEPMKVEIIRDTIPIQTVYAEMRDDGIATVQITSFSEKTADELKDSLADMQTKGMKGLILDLRGNPGGILGQALEISDLFVPNGKVVLQVEDRKGNKEIYKSENKKELGIPVVVLVDKGSASASEIVAAAVKESAGIPLVGEKTFGKGTVQTAEDFKDGSNIKYTSAKWLTPKGNWIHKKGIKPDYEVKLPNYSELTYLSPEQEYTISSSSSEVKVAEQMLKEIGYNPGKVDGFFDEQTALAIKKLQKDQKLTENGILSGDTTLALMNELREKIQKNDTQLLKAVEIIKSQMK